jgi:probable F420-dependent oxidoreductase
MDRGAPMSLGICTYGIGSGDVRDLVVWAEEAGFDRVWVGEHMVVPAHHDSQHPTQQGGVAHHHGLPIVDPTVLLADPLVALAAGAGSTRRVGVATAIYVLPLRHPLVTARSAISLQEASEGRLVLGVGLGWLAEEFTALGIPFDQRVRRYEESIEIIRHACSGGMFAYNGEAFSFPELQITPHPVTVPLVLGGNTDAALRRAARLGDGWITSGTPDFATAARLHDRVLSLADRRFTAHIRVPGLDPEALDRYRTAGMNDLLVWAHQIWDGVDPADRWARRDAVLAAGRLLGCEPAVA